MSELFDSDTEYRVSLKGDISTKARREIHAIVMDEYGHGVLWEDYGGFELVNDDGKIVTRLSKNLKKRLGIKLSPGVKSQIGNIAFNNTVDNGEYMFVISTDMDVWNGECSNIGGSNRGSCFQPGGEYHYCWLAMDDHPDYYVVKLSKIEDGNVMPVYARCWLHDEGNRLAIFNSYGEGLNRIGIILAEALGLKTTQARVGYYNDFYLNGDRINVVGPDVVYRERVDIDLDTYAYSDSLTMCEECGSRIDIDYDSWYEVGSAIMCQSCAGACSGCGDHYVYEDLEDGRHLHGMFCPYCIEEDEDLPRCEECNTRFDPDKAGFFGSHNGRYWARPRSFCGDCAGRCVVCNKYLPRGETRCEEHKEVQPELISISTSTD